MSKDSHDKRDGKVDNFRAWDMSRRDLIKIAGVGLMALAGANLPGIPTCTRAFAMRDKEAEAVHGPRRRGVRVQTGCERRHRCGNQVRKNLPCRRSVPAYDLPGELHGDRFARVIDHPSRINNVSWEAHGL